MKELNQEFRAMSTGKMDFLWKYPLIVDPQVFGFIKGDKEIVNPMMGTKQPHRTDIGTTLMVQGTDPRKDKYIHNKTVRVYGDFNFARKGLDQGCADASPSQFRRTLGQHVLSALEGE